MSESEQVEEIPTKLLKFDIFQFSMNLYVLSTVIPIKSP